MTKKSKPLFTVGVGSAKNVLSNLPEDAGIPVSELQKLADDGLIPQEMVEFFAPEEDLKNLPKID